MFGRKTVQCHTKQMAATTAILSTLSAQPPVESTGWYNNCLCGHKPCHICYSSARGLGNVKYFQAVIRCELDWNRKSWQGAQQLSKDKGEHRWCPCKKTKNKTSCQTAQACFGCSSSSSMGLKGVLNPAVWTKKKVPLKGIWHPSTHHPQTRTQSSIPCSCKPNICSRYFAAPRKNLEDSRLWYLARTTARRRADLWICDLHWSLCLLSPSALTPVTIVFSSEPAQPSPLCELPVFCSNVFPPQSRVQWAVGPPGLFMNSRDVWLCVVVGG